MADGQASVHPHERIEELRLEIVGLRKDQLALACVTLALVQSEVEYMVTNNLGNPLQQHNVRRALRLLASLSGDQ